jgi:membrane protein DedA with SNARE-associated domain
MLAEILNHAEWVVFVVIFANQAGLPVFAAPALIGVGALAANGHVDVGVTATVAVAATLCADLAWYGLGRWRGPWALAAVRRFSRRTSMFVDDAERLFLAHDRAFQLGARFLPEVNPVAAAFAGTARVSLRRFIVGAAATAALWAGAWIGVGYLIGGATREVGTSGALGLAVVVALSAVASLSVVIPPAVRAIFAIWPRPPRATMPRPGTPPGPPAETEDARDSLEPQADSGPVHVRASGPSRCPTRSPC